MDTNTLNLLVLVSFGAIAGAIADKLRRARDSGLNAWVYVIAYGESLIEITEQEAREVLPEPRPDYVAMLDLEGSARMRAATPVTLELQPIDPVETLFECAGCERHFPTNQSGMVTICKGLEFCSEACHEFSIEIPTVQDIVNGYVEQSRSMN